MDKKGRITFSLFSDLIKGFAVTSLVTDPMGISSNYFFNFHQRVHPMFLWFIIYFYTYLNLIDWN